MTPELTKFFIGTGLVFIILIGTLFGTFYYNLIKLRNEEKKINWIEVNLKMHRNRKERLIFNVITHCLKNLMSFDLFSLQSKEVL